MCFNNSAGKNADLLYPMDASNSDERFNSTMKIAEGHEWEPHRLSLFKHGRLFSAPAREVRHNRTRSTHTPNPTAFPNSINTSQMVKIQAKISWSEEVHKRYHTVSLLHIGLHASALTNECGAVHMGTSRRDPKLATRPSYNPSSERRLRHLGVSSSNM